MVPASAAEVFKNARRQQSSELMAMTAVDGTVVAFSRNHTTTRAKTARPAMRGSGFRF